jgi:dihydrodipicolinate synthase/N-acetylneuraminate lyase
MVIPAHPLALTAERKLDERRQRALTRYYIASGVDGIAVGVHTTQFEIRDPKIGLLRPVLELAIEEARGVPIRKIAGVCGQRAQATREAELAAGLGYDAALLSLGALVSATVEELLDHARAIASIIPVVGFYLQPAVGGRVLPYQFWRQFVEIDRVIAVKIAPFNRYQTLDVVRAVAESRRAGAIALYTGNDDSILIDLLTTFDFGEAKIQFNGGLLGHWAVWTHNVVGLVERVKKLRAEGGAIGPEWLTLAQQITDANAAFFDPAHGFHGCIPGIHEVLRRQGLLAGRWCLDPHEELSAGQSEEIDRVYRAYPHLTDDAFVEENLDRWLK